MKEPFSENDTSSHLLKSFDLKSFFTARLVRVIYKFIYPMDYKKKSLQKLNHTESYEEIDTRLASGWYVDSPGNIKKKSYKTKNVTFKISKKTI